VDAASGFITPDLLRTIAAYHPQFALAVLEGVSVRPNGRTVQAVFSSFALNQLIEESFDQQITGYSIFLGADIALDPTGAFNGNLFKGLNDATEQLVTGITTRLQVQSRDGDYYFPIPSQIPLQFLPRKLSRFAGIWAMNSPDNVKQDFYLIATPNGDNPPLTVWVDYTFAVLGDGANRFLCMTRKQAQECLRAEYGFACRCGGAPGASPSP